MVRETLGTEGVRRRVTDQNKNADDAEASEESEHEKAEFELEGLMSRGEGATILRRLADGVESGSVDLGSDEGSVRIPEQVEVELEYEEEYDEAELEIELEWQLVDGEAAPASKDDEDEGDETGEMT